MTCIKTKFVKIMIVCCAVLKVLEIHLYYTDEKITPIYSIWAWMKKDKYWDTLKFNISDSFNYRHYFCLSQLKTIQIFFVPSNYWQNCKILSIFTSECCLVSVSIHLRKTYLMPECLCSS